MKHEISTTFLIKRFLLGTHKICWSFLVELSGLCGHDILLYLGLTHFSLHGDETCKSLLEIFFPLGGHKIPYSFLIKLFLLLKLKT